MHSPEVGRRHDKTLIRHIRTSECLEESLLVDGRQFYMYGDAVYILRACLQTAFDHLSAKASQRTYNTAMNAVRVYVKWNYKDLQQMWTRSDFCRLLTVRRFSVGLLYTASALLIKFKTFIAKRVQKAFNLIS